MYIHILLSSSRSAVRLMRVLSVDKFEPYKTIQKGPTAWPLYIQTSELIQNVVQIYHSLQRSD